MKIRLGQLELARGLAHRESPRRFSLATQRETQAALGLRASAAGIYDRGNARTQLSFIVSRRHESAEQALSFAAAHPSAVGAEAGGLVFTIEGAGGCAELRLPDAALRFLRCVPTGRLTETEYEFIGGALVGGA